MAFVRSSNKIIKNHNKKSYLGKKFYLVNSFFFKKLLYNMEHISLKSRKWLFRKLAKKRLVLNYRSLFIKNNNLNVLVDQDPLSKIFFKFEFFNMVSLSYFKLTDYHIELIRRLARKLFGKKIFINMLIKADFNILRRPNQVRMGGGKGSKFDKKIYFIYPGCSIIQVRGVTKKYIFLFYKKLKKKMPFLFKIIFLNRC